MAAEATGRARPSQPKSWSDLPQDLAGLVLGLLQAYADRACFAAVCPQWHAAARRQLPLLPPPLPLLAFPDGTFYSLLYGKPCRFLGFGCAGYRGAASGSWLVFPRDDACLLVNPFSRATLKLPALARVRLRPLNAAVKYAEIQKQTGRFCTWMDLKLPEKKAIINKLLVCSPNLVAAFFGSTQPKGDGHLSQILVCQPGGSSWSVRALDKCKLFEDMAFYQGKLYAIAIDENLLIVNISQEPNTGDPQVSQIGKVIKADPYPWLETWWLDNTMDTKKLYLVESCGELLMVRRKVCCRILDYHEEIVAEQNKFEVFKADIERSRWVSERWGMTWCCSLDDIAPGLCPRLSTGCQVTKSSSWTMKRRTPQNTPCWSLRHENW